MEYIMHIKKYLVVIVYVVLGRIKNLI